MARWAAYLRVRLLARLAWPGDWLAGALGDLVVAAVGVVVVLALFAHTDRVAGWAAGEVLMAWGLSQAVLGTTRALFGGLWSLNRRYVLGGDLDRVLLRPLDPYGQVLADHVDPGPLSLSAAGVGVFAWGASSAGVALPPAAWAALAAFVAGGVGIVAGVLTATASVGFWVRHEGSAVGLVSQFSGFAHVPLEALPRLWAVLVTTVLPFAFTGVVPAAWFSGHAPWAGFALLQPILGVVFLSLGYAVWRLGLRRYGSAGS